ncbi:transposase [Cuniculiplasma sp. SKW4]|uniref:transposase n=1 Tax=Cuniculiplasma sp. SKW4 TaxID=3400171 RepID=UPI003FD2093A
MEYRLVFLPPYSPDLNPIEFIWKSVKRILSTARIDSEDDLKRRIKDGFEKLSSSLTFAGSWILKFMNKSIEV